MKIQSVQSLAVGESRKYSADNNDAEIINLDDSSDESEVDVTDSVWISLSSDPKSVEGLHALSQDPDDASGLSTGDCDIKSIDENSKDESSTSGYPPDSSESENYDKFTNCPASPESEIESPESSDAIATGKLTESPASPDGEENVEVLDSPLSPDPASTFPQISGSVMKVRIEGDDVNETALTLYNPNISVAGAGNEAEGGSSFGVNSGLALGLAQNDEDWEADCEPNPPFPEHNNGLDYGSILALRALNRPEVDTNSPATDPAQYDDNRNSETEANPPLPMLTIRCCSLGARNDAAVNRSNDSKQMGSNFGCYNCKGDHRCSECPLPLNRAVIKKRRLESKRNQNQRYFKKDVPPPSKHGQIKPGKISDELRSAMDIRRNELPDYIYKMRIHGYPPGYLQQAAESASCKKFYGKNSARQPQPKWTLIRDGLKKYPGFTTPAPKGIVEDGSRFNAPYTNKYTLDNVARNYVNKAMDETEVPTPDIGLSLPKKPVQTSSQFSSSCLGYDRPTPFFNPLPAQNTMDKVAKLYNELVTGKKISPSRDIVAEVERTGNYCYKISENLEKLDKIRKAEEARKEKERITGSPTRRKKRCRSPSLLDPFPDSEDSLDVNLSQNTVASNKVPTAATSTVTSSPGDDECKIIGVEPKAPKLPLDTIVIDSDDDAETKDSQPVFLPNPVYKKPKLMNEVSKHLESETCVSSAKSNKEWGDFLAEYNIIPENNVSQKSRVEGDQFLETVTPRKTNLQSRRSSLGAFTQGSQANPVGENELKRTQDNKLDALYKLGIDNAKPNLYNSFPTMDNCCRDPFRSQTTVVEKYGQLHLIRMETSEKKINEFTAKNPFDDDDDDIQIIE